MSDTDMLDVFLRLGAATLCGMVLGLNRDLHGKPTGIRTLGLVSLGVAIVTVSVLRTWQAVEDIAAYSRVLQGVVQGVLTGIGFLGGGVILRDPQHNMVRNLTTAATVWVTAALGLACAIADWRVIGLGLLFAVVLLVTEDRLDKWIAKKFGEKETDRSQT